MTLQPSLEHSRFSCVPVTGESVLRLSPQSLLQKMQQGGLSDAGGRLNRRLSQPMDGANPQAMMGMLGELDQADLVDFIAEPRCGVMEEMMSQKITEDFSGGRAVSPAPSASPSLARRAKLGSPKPKSR